MAGILGEGETETTYKDSNIFLKGTQSANPHNDYSQHFIDIGQRPQNFIRDVGKRGELSFGSISGGVHSAGERQCFPQRKGSLVPRLSLLKEKESLAGNIGEGEGGEAVDFCQVIIHVISIGSPQLYLPIPPVSLFLFLIDLISFELVIGMHHQLWNT